MKESFSLEVKFTFDIPFHVTHVVVASLFYLIVLLIDL